MTSDAPADRSLRSTFDLAAHRYHRARPRYPNALIDEASAAFGPPATARLLEVGPATGVATEQFADLGYKITAVELGDELAAVARSVLKEQRMVEVITASFDNWDPPEWGVFTGVYAATAWHWLDPATKYERVYRHLVPDGVLAFWSASHVFPPGGDTFFAEIQDVYDEIEGSDGAPLTWPQPGELPDRADEIGASGLFEVESVTHHAWQISYTADEYIDLLDTFSGHIAMAPSDRDRLHGEVRSRLSRRSDPRCHRGWGAVLHVARAIR